MILDCCFVASITGLPVLVLSAQILVIWWMYYRRSRRRNIPFVHQPNINLRTLEVYDWWQGRKLIMVTFGVTLAFYGFIGTFDNYVFDLLGSGANEWRQLLLVVNTIAFAVWWYQLWWNGVRNAAIYVLSGWMLTRLLWFLPFGFSPSYLTINEVNIGMWFLWILAWLGSLFAVLFAYKKHCNFLQWCLLSLIVPFLSLHWLQINSKHPYVQFDDLYYQPGLNFDIMFSITIFATVVSIMRSEIDYHRIRLGCVKVTDRFDYKGIVGAFTLTLITFALAWSISDKMISNDPNVSDMTALNYTSMAFVTTSLLTLTFLIRRWSGARSIFFSYLWPAVFAFTVANLVSNDSMWLTMVYWVVLMITLAATFAVMFKAFGPVQYSLEAITSEQDETQNHWARRERD